MASKALPTENYRCHEASFPYLVGSEEDDRLSEMPDDISLLIICRLSMKEAAILGLTCRRWRNLWARYPKLDFRDLSDAEMRDLRDHESNKRETFITRVNDVLKQHLGETIDEFKIRYHLDMNYQHHFNDWLLFAFQKQVKTFELNFSMFDFIRNHRFSLECCKLLEQPLNLPTISPLLTSLSLDYVDITDKTVECFLRSCKHLEYLCIQHSRSLNAIRVDNLSLPLKRLEVKWCPWLKTIDISAPKLVSFKHFGGDPIELQIQNASSLAAISASGHICSRDYAFGALSKYLPQLKVLRLIISLRPESKPLALYQFQALKKLKHLELIACGEPANMQYEILSRWIPLIEASPLLQKLTVESGCVGSLPLFASEIAEPETNGRRPLRLKTLEMNDFRGCWVDLWLAKYVLRNAIKLKQVHITISEFYDGETKAAAILSAWQLKRLSCSGAKVIVK